MVSVDKGDNSNYVISLSPNSSLVGIYRIIFLASITLVCGGIATIFYFFGAALILPFAGLELTILFIGSGQLFSFCHKPNCSKKSLELAGLTEDMIRFSVGLEDMEDIMTDFDIGFKASQRPRLVASK